MLALSSVLARLFVTCLALLTPTALAGPCPPPHGPPSLSADGAAHVLVADASTACWWIVDDGGDPRVAARWDRARRDPVALVALADGRAVVVLVEAGRARLGVRAEGVGERRLPVELPRAPTRIVAHPERPLVALVWEGEAWVVDVDAAVVTVADQRRWF